MKTDFIQEVIENEDLPEFLQSRSGWETVVFQVEDDPAPAVILTPSVARGKDLK